ncbi:phage tail tube protein [Pseudomonas sp. RC10]|uniref:phage tail tube protein n=1 Tax=Pseudomonas bambusae TaxID=3139142 RepID=UPI00313877A5
MSSGAKATSYLISEVTPGVTPTTGNWKTLRLTGNTLSPKVNTQASDEITDSRVSQGSVATSVDIQGDLAAELSYGSFDELIEAAFYGTWTGDVLTVGDTRHTFTVAKNYNDVSVYALFKGMHVSKFALNIPSDGKITATFSLMGLDYADGETSSVSNILAPTSTPFMSNINLGTILVNGVSLEGSACVSALTLSLDNSLQTQRCLGADRLGPGAHIATEAVINGNITMAWSKSAWQLWKNQFTRAPISVEFPITDSLGNKYTLKFPALEIDGDLPNGGKRELIEVTLNYTVSKVAPTITRLPAPSVSSVAVAPTTANVAVGATRQLTPTVLPSGSPQGVTWSSATPSVATVSSTGVVTGVSAGTAVITATSTSDGSKSSSSTITVS